MGRTDTTLDDPSAPSSPRRTVATVRVLFEAGRVCESPPRELADGTIEIGRAVDPPGLVLDDGHVSRRHALLRVDAVARQGQLENLSRRGTEVEGERIDRTSLADGQLITMGHTHLLFRWEERPLDPDAPLAGLLGSAPSIRRVRAFVRVLAPTRSVVLLLGETGTGKEVVARAIHEASGRTGAFVAVNCAAIPEQLAESQLFGHVAGSFTGAQRAAEGFFRAAANGTIFLDEVGDLPPSVQAKLLRALETGEVAPLGSFHEVPHEARVIAATHRDLLDDVEVGHFRRDLYARLADFVLTLPPLRDRREDVLPILRHAHGEGMPPIDWALARALLLHPWPFNVRELVRLASQLRLHAAPSGLGLPAIEESLARTARLAPPAPSASEPPPDTPRGPPDKVELEGLLRRHGGVVADVARATGRSRKQVYRWIAQHGIAPDAFREE